MYIVRPPRESPCPFLSFLPLPRESPEPRPLGVGCGGGPEPLPPEGVNDGAAPLKMSDDLPPLGPVEPLFNVSPDFKRNGSLPPPVVRLPEPPVPVVAVPPTPVVPRPL